MNSAGNRSLIGQRKGLLTVLLIVTLFLFNEAYAIWISVPLEDRVCKADLIVIGTLQDVKEKVFFISHLLPLNDSTGIDEGKNIEDITYFNCGWIKIERVLKGEWNKEYVPFVYARVEGVLRKPDGSEVRTRKAIYKSMQYFNGDSGIWILVESDKFLRKFFMVDYPGNFISTDSLATVQKLIVKCRRREF